MFVENWLKSAFSLCKASKRLSENMMPIGQKKNHMPYLIIFQIKLLKQALFNMKTNAKLVLVLSY